MLERSRMVLPFLLPGFEKSAPKCNNKCTKVAKTLAKMQKCKKVPTLPPNLTKGVTLSQRDLFKEVAGDIIEKFRNGTQLLIRGECRFPMATRWVGLDAIEKLKIDADTNFSTVPKIDDERGGVNLTS